MVALRKMYMCVDHSCPTDAVIEATDTRVAYEIVPLPQIIQLVWIFIYLLVVRADYVLKDKDGV